jgi:glutathione S-transferase
MSPTLTITRLFKAPRERVFEAFTQVDAIQAWYGPEGFTVPGCRCDPKPGGSYRIEMHSPEGSVHIVTGKYLEVHAPDKLVFTWAWLEGAGRGPQTTVSLSFVDKAGHTELTLVQSGFVSDLAREQHSHGWNSSFNSLEAMLDGRQQPVEARPTLLGDPRSSYVRSARLAFEEKGIAYTLLPLAPHSPEVDAIHPKGKIPVFRIGSNTLFETSAILHYVDAAFPGPALMPDSPLERAQVEQWISAINAYYYDSMVRRYVLQYVFPKGEHGQPDREVIEQAIADIQLDFALLDKAYGERDYLVGNGLTLADLLLAPIVFYVSSMPEGKAILEPFANVRRAYSVISQRPSFAATMPPLGQ